MRQARQPLAVDGISPTRPGVQNDLHRIQFELHIHSLSCLIKYTARKNRLLVSRKVFHNTTTLFSNGIRIQHQASSVKQHAKSFFLSWIILIAQPLCQRPIKKSNRMRHLRESKDTVRQSCESTDSAIASSMLTKVASIMLPLYQQRHKVRSTLHTPHNRQQLPNALQQEALRHT